MKSAELQACSEVLQSLVDTGGDEVTVNISKEQKDALKRLLAVVSGLSRAAEEFTQKKSTLSMEQRQYLANFNDTSVSPAAEVRRGEKLHTIVREPMTSDQARAKLQSCIRKAVLMNRIIRTDRTSSRLDIELSKLVSWQDFDINAVSRLSDRKPLQAVGMACFQKYGLMSKFGIPLETMQNFLAAVEDHYFPNPYHNSTHAADVTQNLICLLEADHLIDKFTDLEVFAMILSAVIHDVGHPGWNNAFLVNTQDESAIVYNDASVNENMSLSLGFKILQYPECNIFCNMNREDYFYVRKLAIDIILATDMQFHGAVVDQFSTAMNSEDHDDWDSWKLTSRALVMKMLVHCADLGNPCKPPRQAGMWAQAVYDEFFRQGDAEREAGLPVFPLFDRHAVKIHASQATFLEYVVLPCWKALANVAPKASERGLYWMDQNSALWQEMADKDMQHGIIGFDTSVKGSELVHVAPRQSRNRKSSAWGNMELLTTLMLDKSHINGHDDDTESESALTDEPRDSSDVEPATRASSFNLRARVPPASAVAESPKTRKAGGLSFAEGTAGADLLPDNAERALQTQQTSIDDLAASAEA